MLTLNRYPGQAILLEYGNTLELLYCKYKNNIYHFEIYINNILKETYIFKRDTHIIFEDDNLIFKFRIEAKTSAGAHARKITIWCPDFVVIRRKEIPAIKR